MSQRFMSAWSGCRKRKLCKQLKSHSWGRLQPVQSQQPPVAGQVWQEGWALRKATAKEQPAARGCLHQRHVIGFVIWHKEVSQSAVFTDSYRHRVTWALLWTQPLNLRTLHWQPSHAGRKLNWFHCRITKGLMCFNRVWSAQGLGPMGRILRALPGWELAMKKCHVIWGIYSRCSFQRRAHRQNCKILIKMNCRSRRSNNSYKKDSQRIPGKCVTVSRRAHWGWSNQLSAAVFYW